MLESTATIVLSATVTHILGSDSVVYQSYLAMGFGGSKLSWQTKGFKPADVIPFHMKDHPMIFIRGKGTLDGYVGGNIKRLQNRISPLPPLFSFISSHVSEKLDRDC